MEDKFDAMSENMYAVVTGCFFHTLVGFCLFLTDRRTDQCTLHPVKQNTDSFFVPVNSVVPVLDQFQ